MLRFSFAGFGTTETQIGSKGGNKTSNLKPSGQMIDQQLTRCHQKITNKNGRSKTNINLVKESAIIDKMVLDQNYKSDSITLR